MSTVTSKERLNIKSLTVDQPTKEMNFDFSKDFYLKTWHAYQQAVREHADPELPDEKLGRFRTAARLRTIAGLTAEDLGFTEKENWLVQIHIEKTRDLTKEWRSSHLLDYLATFKLLFPEETGRLALDEGLWQRVATEMDITKSVGVIFLANGFDLKLLFPERFSKLDLSDKWPKFALKLEGRKAGLVGFPYTRLAACVRVVLPDNWEEVRPGIEQWQEIKENLRSQSSGFNRFVEEMFYINILRAEEVIIDDHSLRLIMPTPDLELGKTAALPETRRF